MLSNSITSQSSLHLTNRLPYKVKRRADIMAMGRTDTFKLPNQNIPGVVITTLSVMDYFPMNINVITVQYNASVAATTTTQDSDFLTYRTTCYSTSDIL